ncbi:MAG: M81 family metallopeptidase [Bryobacterales bacterium]|nr:M81 family metallopeptidase [Bryobacterales bacterium]
MKPRIAVGAIFTESNHLVGRMTDMENFERTEFRRGEEVLAATDGVLGGSIAALRGRGAEPVPLIYASAVPGGPLTIECYAALKADLLGRLQAALPVEGVLMPQHGAAAVDEIGDLDGDLIARVRELVGNAVPVVVTLDCHAHVTEQMVGNADALLAWETYPHRDSYSTGARGANMLMDIVEKRVRPTMAMAKAPVIVGGYMGSTDDGPFAEFMRKAKSLEQLDRVLSTSAFLVQPQLDLPDMGGGALVITDNDIDRAVELAAALGHYYWNLRSRLETPVRVPAGAIAEGLQIDGTVLLLETSDCVGGGATGDSAAIIRALLEAGVEDRSLAMVVDPESAAACHQRAEGEDIALRLGHKLDPRWGEPLEVTAQIEQLTDGKFVYSGGIWEGITGDMGASAKLRIGNIEVLVMSKPTYDWADEQYRSAGMNSEGAKFIVVKNPMNYRIGYDGKFRAAFPLDTPGPTVASLRHVKFQRLARPYFPADQDIPGFTPRILRGRA